MPGDGNDVTDKVQQAGTDAATLKTELKDLGPAETYEKLKETVDSASNSSWSENAKSAYFQTLSQTLNRNGVLPELTINYLNDKGPKQANGEILKDNAADGKDLAQELKALVGQTNKVPGSAIDRIMVKAAMQNFDKLATAGDTDKGSISKADLAKLLKDQPKRKP